MTGTRRIQILFLVPSLRGGGSERVITTLLRHLDRSRFCLILAVVDLRLAVYRGELLPDVEVIDLECSRVRYAMPKIARLIWKRRPDMVFSTLGHLNLALSIMRPALPDAVKYIARESAIVSEVIREYHGTSIWAWGYRRFYGRFDTVICQSRYMRNDLIENFGLSPSKAVVINNPVDAQYIRRLAQEPLDTGFGLECWDDGEVVINLVAVGRMVSEKGFDLLIEALAQCADSRLRLTLLGEGPMRGEMEALARSKGIAGQVRFVGFQRNPYPFIAQADALVVSSRSEGFPNVVLEALACGTPVAAVPAPGGVREILEGVDDCVIAEGMSVKGLARALRQVSHRRRLSESVVESYAVKNIVVRYEQALMSHATL